MLKNEYTPKTVATLLMGALMTKKPTVGARNKAVWEYGIEVLDSVATNGDDENRELWTQDKLRDLLLNGAFDYYKPYDEQAHWKRYSEGGCSLIWNIEIAQRVCTPNQYKKLEDKINSGDDTHDWIMIQARCLFDAAQLIYQTFNSLND